MFAAALSADDKWSTTATLGTKARARDLAHYDGGYLALFSHEPDYQVYYRVRSATGTWTLEKPLTPAATSANYIALDTRGARALFTWNAPSGRMQASLFDGTTWATEDLGPVSGGTYASVGAEKHLVTWLYQFNAYGAVYDLKTGWDDSIKLGPTSAEDFGPAAEVDPAGNSLVAWPDGAHVTWRRLGQFDTDWSEPQQIEDQDPYALNSTVDAAGNVMLVWSNPLGVWASRFE